MRHEFPYWQRGLAILHREGNGLARKHVAPRSLRINTRRHQPGVLPYGLPHGRLMAVREQSGDEPGHYHDGRTVPLTAAEPKHMLALRPCHLDREILPYGKEPRMYATAVEGQRSDIQLYTPVFPMDEELLRQRTPTVAGRRGLGRNSRSISCRRA